MGTRINRNNHKVTVWSKVKAELDAIRETGQNERSLPGVMIPKEIVLSEDLKALAENNDILIMAVASPYVRSTAKELYLTGVKNLKIVNVAKGIEEGTLRTMTQIIEEEIPDCKTAVLSGPSHAEEVSRFLPTTCVVGAADKDFALYSMIERMAPEVISQKSRIYKGVSANVDFYSGFVYSMLEIPLELYTPIFAIARIVGWSAHRIEELIKNLH